MERDGVSGQAWPCQAPTYPYLLALVARISIRGGICLAIAIETDHPPALLHEMNGQEESTFQHKQMLLLVLCTK